jgi:ArsR family transcriptional regulator
MAIETLRLLQLLSDETRLRCLVLLKREGELCVCELVYALGASQPKISRHLATLRRAGIVRDRRAGQWIYYRVSSALPVRARQIVDAAVVAATEEQPFVGDAAALGRMPQRPKGVQCA